MSNLVLLSGLREARTREGRERLVEGLEELLQRAKDGELRGVCYSGISDDGQSICVGALKDDSCGAHELVGASALLADYMVRSAASE